MPKFSAEINQSNSRALLYLFYECYRHGVEDASETNDENRCRDYVTYMNNTHVYRLVGNDFDMSWKEWRIRLIIYASNMKGRRDLMRKMLLGIDRYGLYFCVPLRAAMEFYIEGVKDFINYPVYDGLELFFNDTHLRKWQKGFQYALYRTPQNILEDMTKMLYDRVRYDVKVSAEKLEGHTIAISDRTYNLFIELMYSKITYGRQKPKWDKDL